jgi:hypothetical protein
MAWTVGSAVKKGPQGLVQHLETAVAVDDTTATDVAHGFSGPPEEFYLRESSAGTVFGIASTASPLTHITCTPSASDVTFVLVAKSYSQAV